MKIYNKNNVEVRAIKVCKPRFSKHFGRTWQWGTMTIDELETQYTYDNTWGSWWYFHWYGQWYKVNIFEQYEPHWNMKFTTQRLKPD